VISVIIPTYNHASSLGETIESVLKQEGIAFELIVVNDGSTDETSELLAAYEDRPNITVIHQKNKGRNPARNRGFLEAKGDQLIFLDADADLDPDTLVRLSHALIASDAAFSYGDFRYGFKHFITGPFDADRLRKMNFVHVSALIKRSNFPGFDDAILRFQDWDLWLTITEQGGHGLYVPGESMRFSTQEKGISSWMPKAWYHAPWKWLPWIRSRVQAYEAARRIIQAKHHLI